MKLYTLTCVSCDNQNSDTPFGGISIDDTFIYKTFDEAHDMMESCFYEVLSEQFAFNNEEDYERYKLFTGSGELDYVACLDTVAYIQPNKYSGHDYSYAWTIGCTDIDL